MNTAAAAGKGVVQHTKHCQHAVVKAVKSPLGPAAAGFPTLPRMLLLLQSV
jgi:hypothetical protein